MDTAQRQELAQKIDTFLTVLWGIGFLVFPFAFLTVTTDGVQLPKEILLGALVLLSFLLWGAKMLLEKQVKIRRTPFDIPVILFGVALLLSSLFSVSRVDSLIATVPVLFGVLAYFAITNSVKDTKRVLFLTACLLVGGLASALVGVLAAYKIYLIPLAPTHTTIFTTFGTFTDQAVYLAALLPLALTLSLPLLKKKVTAKPVVYGVLSLVGIALLIGSLALVTKNPPTLLPFATGFQTAFAAISQDSARLLQGFFFGSGFGMFGTVFTRFHQASFNTNQALWFLPFNQSSSFVLELLATTGLVGVLGYFFLLLRVLFPLKDRTKSPVYVSLLLLAVVSFVLPLTFLEITLFFLLLSVFALSLAQKAPHEYYDVELQFVAFKKGIFSFTSVDEHTKVKTSNAAPVAGFVVLLAVAVILGYFSTTYVLSDLLFQQSLVAAQQNSGTVAYKDQAQAIITFPYKTAYYRIFSQTNISLANSLLALSAGKSSPSAQVQQTAYTLIQQSITAARQATNLSPMDVTEWQNLSSVYRSLIGLGQNADTFALQAAQQAIVLDPNNPQEYLALGGIYYQLGQFDNAIKYFQQATALKTDYANAYYNAGHAYEQKQDFQNALQNYQVVAQLMQSDKANEEKIQAEITALEQKTGAQGTSETSKTAAPVEENLQHQPLTQPQSPVTPAPVSQQIPLVTPTQSK